MPGRPGGGAHLFVTHYECIPAFPVTLTILSALERVNICRDFQRRRGDPATFSVTSDDSTRQKRGIKRSVYAIREYLSRAFNAGESSAVAKKKPGTSPGFNLDYLRSSERHRVRFYQQARGFHPPLPGFPHRAPRSSWIRQPWRSG